jgi:hypothetical protein
MPIHTRDDLTNNLHDLVNNMGHGMGRPQALAFQEMVGIAFGIGSAGNAINVVIWSISSSSYGPDASILQGVTRRHRGAACRPLPASGQPKAQCMPFLPILDVFS